MNTELVPIFKLRQLCLALVNPAFYAKNADLIYRASLAAQDYIFSGASREYQTYLKDNFQTLPGYVAVHQKYNLTGLVNPNLVMDLMWGFKTDNINGIIDMRGNIKNTAILPKSRIMGTYHNSDLSGIPINAFKLYPEQIEKLLITAQQHTK